MRRPPDLLAVGPGHLEVVITLHALCFAEPWGRDAITAILAGVGGFGLLALEPETGAPGGVSLGPGGRGGGLGRAAGGGRG